MGGQGRVLVLADDDDLRAALVEQLAALDEFDVREARAGAEGVERAAAEPHDLVILDAGAEDALALCRALCGRGVGCPVLLLAEAGRDLDAEAVGASEVLAKPFKLAALLARARERLRRHEVSEEAVFRLGPYAFRPAAKLLTDEAGGEIRLTEKETDILRFLHRAAGRTVDRETLLREVWGYSAGVTTHTLETHVYRLRQKIEADPADARLLTTEAGGYRLSP